MCTKSSRFIFGVAKLVKTEEKDKCRVSRRGKNEVVFLAVVLPPGGVLPWKHRIENDAFSIDFYVIFVHHFV